MRGLIHELETLIHSNDPRWEAFGLNIPAHPRAPDSVTGLTAGPLGNGRIEIAFLYATRSTRFRVETFIVGVDTEWQSQTSVKELEVILKGFTAGQVVKLRVIAANDGGDAAPSPEAQVQVA